MLYLIFNLFKRGLIVNLKCILLIAFVFCSGCNAQSDLIKPEGEWQKINPVNPVTNQFVDIEKEAKNGR